MNEDKEITNPPIGGATPAFNPGNNKNAVGAFVAVANLLSNITSNSANARINRENNRFNAEQSQLAFNREAAYNSPSAMMQRLRAAGLNPNLALGDISSGTADTSAASAASPIAMSPYNLDPLTFSEASLNMAQARNLDADTDNKPIVAEKMRAEIQHYANLDETNRRLVDKWRKDMQLTDQQIIKCIEESKVLTAQVEHIRKQIDVGQATINKLEKELQVMDADIQQKGARSRYYQAVAQSVENRNLLWDDESASLRSGFKLDAIMNQANIDSLTPPMVQSLINTIQNNIRSEEHRSSANAYISMVTNEAARNVYTAGSVDFPIKLAGLNTVLKMLNGQWTMPHINIGYRNYEGNGKNSNAHSFNFGF